LLRTTLPYSKGSGLFFFTPVCARVIPAMARTRTTPSKTFFINPPLVPTSQPKAGKAVIAMKSSLVP